jgi:glycosyltransferase involved in cell wall biosynthesis
VSLDKKIFPVSVIIPVFNRPDDALNAVRSVLRQSISCHEIIVVDDGSDVNIKIDINDQRIKLIKHSINKGAAEARNTGIKYCTGDYIAFLDSDDVWTSKKLELQLKFMQEMNFQVCCTGYTLLRQNNKVEERISLKTSLALEDMVWGCFIGPGSTLMVKKEVYDFVGLYDSELKRYEDWDWLIRCASKYKIGMLKSSLVVVKKYTAVNSHVVYLALELIRKKHLLKLKGRAKKKFKAACHIETAATAFRDKQFVKAFLFVINSIILYPFNNFALKKAIASKTSNFPFF